SPGKFRNKLARMGRGDPVLMYVNTVGVVAVCITALWLKVERFNEFLRLNPEEFLGLRMWHWDSQRSDDREPSRIPRELCRLRLFVFLGRHRATGEGIDYEAILGDFDKLLPLYEF